jgi:ABC-2 type transport system permease protein
VNKLLAVIRREYIARVRSKWFIITTLLAPVLMIGAMVIPVLLVVRQAERTILISAVDETGALVPELLETEPFKDGRLRYMPPPGGDSETAVATLRQRVIDQQLTGYLFIPADALDGGSIEFWGHEAGQTILRATLVPATTTALRRLQARALGLDPADAEKLTREVDLQTYRVTDEGAAREEGQTVITAHILALLIYLVVLLYGAMMLRAAVAEKSSKTVEIILSSLRPWQLMLGKTLGVGAVGLTQIGIWLVLISAFLLYAASAQAFADAEFLKNLPIGIDTLFIFVGLFLTGYFLYGGLYASVGAIASSEQEASQLQFPVTLLVIIPVFVIPIVLETPSSQTSIVLSWIPFFTPVLFLARYVLGVVAIWEIPLVFTLQLLTILLVAWIGGRIYRVGLLMTGKRPTLPELIRWIRHG